MVRTVEFYKKCVSTLATVLMGTCMLLTLGVILYNFYRLNEGTFFLSRTRKPITRTIDFEEITTVEVFYFLYRNQTSGAIDAGEENNFFIVNDAEKLCNYEGVYFESNPNRITTIRNNIYASFMVVSEAYIFILMLVLLFFTVYLIPVKMKEYHVPIILRRADENMFHVIMRGRNACLLIFIALSGSLPHLFNYFVEDVCLHANTDPIWFSAFDVNMTDYY